MHFKIATFHLFTQSIRYLGARGLRNSGARGLRTFLGPLQSLSTPFAGKDKLEMLPSFVAIQLPLTHVAHSSPFAPPSRPASAHDRSTAACQVCKLGGERGFREDVCSP